MFVCVHVYMYVRMYVYMCRCIVYESELANIRFLSMVSVIYLSNLQCAQIDF